MRIAFDVSPLSHERTGVNNYIRGSLQGIVEVGREQGDEVVAFAPTSPRGRHAIPEALEGIERYLDRGGKPRGRCHLKAGRAGCEP